VLPFYVKKYLPIGRNNNIDFLIIDYINAIEQDLEKYLALKTVD
jgi:hypothetical protein